MSLRLLARSGRSDMTPSRASPGRRGPEPPAHRRDNGHVLLLFQPKFGGVPQYVANLAEGLAERGWEVSVAAPSNTPVRDRLALVSRNVMSLDTPSLPSPKQDLRIVRELAGACDRDAIDVIHAHSSKAGAIATIVGKLAGVPSLYSPHAWSFQREMSSPAEHAYVAIERLLARRHAQVIAVADAERAEAERRGVVSPGRAQLISTGIRDTVLPSREAAREQIELDEQAFAVGWVGRAGPQKRSEQLPQLARDLTGDAVFVALGYGIAESDAGRELEQVGGTVVRGATPETVYAAADAVVVTSRWEGAPLVVLEAMRAGLPVVAYDIGGVAEQVKDGVTGYVVEPGNADALAGRLRELAQQPDLARRMGRAARRRFLDRFAFGRMIGHIEEAYRQVLDAPAEPDLRRVSAEAEVAQ
jgi:glycosyltransferase involved in cell wall biosynthesis